MYQYIIYNIYVFVLVCLLSGSYSFFLIFQVWKRSPQAKKFSVPDPSDAGKDCPTGTRKVIWSNYNGHFFKLDFIHYLCIYGYSMICWGALQDYTYHGQADILRLKGTLNLNINLGSKVSLDPP